MTGLTLRRVTEMENFKIDVDADGLALITFDVPGRSMNTITASVMKDIGEIVERIKSDAAIKGAIITSGKASGFCAGCRSWRTQSARRRSQAEKR